jgi:uncharacterized membrane protein
MNTLTRWARHLWLDAADARRILTPAGLQRLEQAVKDSESRHLGELRLCVEASLPLAALRGGVDARSRAIDLFSQLRVWDTEHNNGVLIYLLLADRKIEIVADRGLSRQVRPPEWDAVIRDMSHHMHQGLWETALGQAIDAVTDKLCQHFPVVEGQARVNELPDKPVIL